MAEHKITAETMEWARRYERNRRRENLMQVVAGISLGVVLAFVIAWSVTVYLTSGNWTMLILFALALGMAYPSGWLIVTGITDMRRG